MCSMNAHIARRGERYTTHRPISHERVREWTAATAPCTREFVTESPVLQKVRKLLANLEQSSLRNDNFFEAVVF
jgi:hypothetical protein